VIVMVTITFECDLWQILGCWHDAWSTGTSNKTTVNTFECYYRTVTVTMDHLPTKSIDST
jgi:hypothetical protein